MLESKEFLENFDEATRYLKSVSDSRIAQLGRTSARCKSLEKTFEGLTKTRQIGSKLKFPKWAEKGDKIKNADSQVNKGIETWKALSIIVHFYLDLSNPHLMDFWRRSLPAFNLFLSPQYRCSKIATIAEVSLIRMDGEQRLKVEKAKLFDDLINLHAAFSDSLKNSKKPPTTPKVPDQGADTSDSSTRYKIQAIVGTVLFLPKAVMKLIF